MEEDKEEVQEAQEEERRRLVMQALAETMNAVRADSVFSVRAAVGNNQIGQGSNSGGIPPQRQDDPLEVARRYPAETFL